MELNFIAGVIPGKTVDVPEDEIMRCLAGFLAAGGAIEDLGAVGDLGGQGGDVAQGRGDGQTVEGALVASSETAVAACSRATWTVRVEGRAKLAASSLQKASLSKMGSLLGRAVASELVAPPGNRRLVTAKRGLVIMVMG